MWRVSHHIGKNMVAEKESNSWASMVQVYSQHQVDAWEVEMGGIPVSSLMWDIEGRKASVNNLVRSCLKIINNGP